MRALVLAAFVAKVPGLAPAQEVTPLRGGMLEASGFAHRVTNEFGDWRAGLLGAGYLRRRK